jgi:hypothetical protein
MDDDIYDIEWYEKQLENDESGNWSCFTDVANARDPEFVEEFMNGNWSMAVDERSDDPVLIPTNRAVGQKSVYYKPGSTIKIQIVGSAQFVSSVQKVLTDFAQPHINLKFQFVNTGGDITIDNNYSGGGVARCLGCQKPSISISSAAQGLVLHEFGHALGMQHEMKNPNIKLTWIESVLTQAYGGADFVKSQITSTVNAASVNATPFDKNSVMIYNLPANTNKEGVDMRPSNTYTELDKQWLIMTYGPPVGFTGTVAKTPSKTVAPKVTPRVTPSKIPPKTIATTTTTTTTTVAAKGLKGPQEQLDLLPPIAGTGTRIIGSNQASIIVTQPSWLDNIILFVLSFFS